ncbi:MAG TPA: methionine synthase [Bdellovibrionales bacterium]|nr:methionine synthase [Bdellovibrionales bacterium]
MRERVLVLDGAMGTALQVRNLTANDFGGASLEGCNENLNLTRPKIIGEILGEYLQAGADIVETNTFGATPLVLAEYDISDRAYEINFQAARIAREMADKYSTAAQPRFVAGSMGPTTKALSVTGGTTFEELIENYYLQAKALYEGGVDYFLLETCQDTRNVKAGILGIQKFLRESKAELPIAVSGTIEPMGTMLAGQAVDSLAISLEHVDLLYLGLNCATGPEFMTDHIRTLATQSGRYVSCVPNAGLPDEHGKYLETPQSMVAVLQNFGREGWLNFIGGCCGTTPAHIEAMAQLAKTLKPHAPQKLEASTLSGIESLEVTDEKRPIIVGERTNVIGSKKFKELIVAEKFDEAAEIAKAQVKKGAHIIDMCLANPDRDEKADMKRFLEAVIRQVKVPLMIDSTDADVIEMSLTYSQGKAIINSINLEDGEERFEHVVPLAKKFGAALVVGCIDDDPVQGMAITKERKLQVAERSYKLLTEKYGVAPEDIYWDPLVFPCGTGDQQYVGSAAQTIEGVRLLKQHFPKCKTILGISNVSFGLPAAGREVLNTVFLYHCTQAGLDLAIVNSEKLERYTHLTDTERQLAEDLIFNRGEDPVAAFTAHFRAQKPKQKLPKTDIPIDKRLANYIIEGTKDGLAEDLTEMLKTHRPLEIINGPLMAGMDEVGRLFNDNKLIVAEVLQSAESMKAAVAHLEPYMEKTDTSLRGKLLLATVKGDVHDIGKNLVDIILSNNGFKVINLGIKVPPETLIQAVREHKPDFIGLSGLLVKSAQQMVVTAHDLSQAGINIPMLVGGAALSRNFVDRQIAEAYEGLVDYASDAMSGLETAKKIVNKDTFAVHYQSVKERRQKLKQAAKPVDDKPQATSQRSREVELLQSTPSAPDYERHISRNIPIEAIWKYINPLMLYTRHLGVKGRHAKLWENQELNELKSTPEGLKALKIFEAVEEVKKEFREQLVPKSVYKFFAAQGDGNTIHIFDSGRVAASISFPRQRRADGLCLSDYVLPKSGGQMDNIAMFAVTVGEGIRDTALRLKDEGQYLKSTILQILAMESAEALAELLHAQLRTLWGFPDPLNMTMTERFQAKYRGKRYSFGYPACPDLNNQAVLFDLLKPEEIGIELTDGFMMDPEASVTAIVFHHPQAVYFSVGGELPL